MGCINCNTRLIIDNVEFHLVFTSILIFNLLSFVEENIDVDGFSDEFDSDYASEDVILEVRNIVQNVRKFCAFVKNSTKC